LCLHVGSFLIWILFLWFGLDINPPSISYHSRHY
jgi:hypothetical protein